MLTFSSGLNIDLDSFKKILKRQGLIMLLKLGIAVGLSLLYVELFGQSGILGISAVAFTVVIVSMNPALYISLVEDFGTEIDKAAFGFTGLFSIPVIPVLIFSLGGQAPVNWLPMLTILPLIIGIVLGNLDPDLRGYFGGTVVILLPLLGWNMGQSMNLVTALQAGVSGIVLGLFYYVFTSVLVVFDKRILKNDGVAAMAMNAVAALSTSIPAVLAQSNPELQQYVPTAVAQILMVSLISVFVTPMIIRKLTK